MNSDSPEVKDAARAEYHARWEAVEAFKAQELAAMTEERAWEIIHAFSFLLQTPLNHLRNTKSFEFNSPHRMSSSSARRSLTESNSGRMPFSSCCVGAGVRVVQNSYVA